MAGGQNVSIRAPKVASIQAMTSAYGRVIPLIYGKGRVQANVIYYTDFVGVEKKTKKSAGGKGGGGSTTNIDYTYTVCALFGLSEGIANASLGTIWLGKNKGTAAEFGLSYFNGSSTQSPLGYIATNHPTEALSYRNTSYIGAAKMSLGNDASMPSVNAEIIGRSSGVNVGLSVKGDANIADIIYDIITDSTACLGLPASSVGSLSAIRTYSQAAELLVSPVYTEAKSARDMITSLCTIANTGVFFSEGVAKFVPFGDVAISANGTTYTPNLTPAYDLTEDHFLTVGDETVRVSRKAQADAYNHVKLTYQNRLNDYNDDIVEAKDQASIEANGLRTMSESSMSEIADTVCARRVAQQILQRASNIRNTYEFSLGWGFARLEPMDIVTLTESGLGLVAEPVRIIEIEEDDEGFRIKAEEMQVGSLGAAQHPSQGSTGYKTDYNIAAGNTNTPVIFEPPTSLSGTPQLWIAASGAGSWGGCNVWVSDDNATYQQVGIISGKARHGVLTAITPAGSALDITNTVKIDLTVSGGQVDAGTTQNATDLTTLCYVDGELLSYRDATLTGPNAYTLGYLVRGAYGSTIGSHASATKFARLDQSIFRYDYDPKFLGRTIYIKLQSFNVYGSAVQDLAALTASTYTFAGAQIDTVSGLELEQPFIGDSFKIKWSSTAGAVDYTVEIRDTGGLTLYRSVRAPNTRYEYTWQDSLADGGPFRALQVRVRANSKNGASGAFSTLSVSNPVPAALTGLSVTGGFGIIFFEWSVNLEPDIAGYQVWMSATSGFTPGSGNLIYDGTDNKITTRTLNGGTAIVAGTTYFIRMAGYDRFGKTGLNISSELSATALTIAGGISPSEITAAMIAAGAVDMTKFASGIRPPRNVATLPAIDGTIYANGDTVTLTTDGKLYRAVAGAWTAAIPSTDITGTLTDAQLAAIASSKITGTLTDSQLAAIAAAKITGTLTDAQIAAISANKVTGQIVGTQITDSAITSPKIAANAITADKILIKSAGAVINDDPNFSDGTAWSIGSGITLTVGASGAGAVAPTYAQCTSTLDSAIISAKLYPISIAKTYLLTAVLTAAATNNRNVRIVADFYDSLGTYIAGIVIFNDLPASSAWARSGGQIGAGTANAIPPGATQCRVYVRFQMSTSGTTAALQGAQDFRLEEVLGSTLIQDGAITTNKIFAGAVTAGKIAAGSIVATDIAASTITATEIASGAITTAKLAAGAVTANEIAANTITAAKIAAGAIGATEIAANSITASQIAIGGVTGTTIANGAITTSKIAANAVTAGEIAANTITATQIAANTITGDKLLADTVDSTRIDSRNLTIKNAAGVVVFSAGVPLDFASVGGTTKPANNATVGATIGTNLSGQITSANASTFIANAAINTAQIGSLNASVITAGTITTDRIQVGAASATAAASGALASLTVNGTNSSANLTTWGPVVTMTKTYSGSTAIGESGANIIFATHSTLASGYYTVQIGCTGAQIVDSAGTAIGTGFDTSSLQKKIMYLVASTSYVSSSDGTVSVTVPNASFTGSMNLRVSQPQVVIRNPTTNAEVTNSLASASIMGNATLREIKV